MEQTGSEGIVDQADSQGMGLGAVAARQMLTLLQVFWAKRLGEIPVYKKKAGTPPQRPDLPPETAEVSTSAWRFALRPRDARREHNPGHFVGFFYEAHRLPNMSDEPSNLLMKGLGFGRKRSKLPLMKLGLRGGCRCSSADIVAAVSGRTGTLKTMSFDHTLLGSASSHGGTA